MTQEEKPLELEVRLTRTKFYEYLCGIPAPQFESLVFTLNPPRGTVSDISAPQGNRVSQLLGWACGSIGPGLDKICEVLGEITGKVIVLSDPAADDRDNSNLGMDPLENNLGLAGLPKQTAEDQSKEVPREAGELTSSRKPVQIFLAHAKEDKDAVLELYERLKKEGLKSTFGDAKT